MSTATMRTTHSAPNHVALVRHHVHAPLSRQPAVQQAANHHACVHSAACACVRMRLGDRLKQSPKLHSGTTTRAARVKCMPGGLLDAWASVLGRQHGGAATRHVRMRRLGGQSCRRTWCRRHACRIAAVAAAARAQRHCDARSRAAQQQQCWRALGQRRREHDRDGRAFAPTTIARGDGCELCGEVVTPAPFGSPPGSLLLTPSARGPRFVQIHRRRGPGPNLPLHSLLSLLDQRPIPSTRQRCLDPHGGLRGCADGGRFYLFGGGAALSLAAQATSDGGSSAPGTHHSGALRC